MRFIRKGLRSARRKTVVGALAAAMLAGAQWAAAAPPGGIGTLPTGLLLRIGSVPAAAKTLARAAVFLDRRLRPAGAGKAGVTFVYVLAEEEVYDWRLFDEMTRTGTIDCGARTVTIRHDAIYFWRQRVTQWDETPATMLRDPPASSAYRIAIDWACPRIMPRIRGPKPNQDDRRQLRRKG
jgi:hypothetical protein